MTAQIPEQPVVHVVDQSRIGEAEVKSIVNRIETKNQKGNNKWSDKKVSVIVSFESQGAHTL